MKLQKKNKYSNRITNGICTLTLISALLTGCSTDKNIVDSIPEVAITPEPTPIIVEEPDPVVVTEEPIIIEEKEYSEICKF